MESYLVVDTRTNKVLDKLELNLATIQGVCTSYVIAKMSITNSKNRVLILESEFVKNSSISKVNDDTPKYYSFCRDPSHFALIRSVKQFPYIWINQKTGQFPTEYFCKDTKKDGDKGVGTNESGTECRIVDLITTDIESYKNGLLLMDKLNGLNNSYYIYDLQPDGTTKNPDYLSALSGFNWNGLPKELQLLIMIQDFKTWLYVSKGSYDSVLPMLHKISSPYTYRLIEYIIMRCSKESDLSESHRRLILNYMNSGGVLSTKWMLCNIPNICAKFGILCNISPVDYAKNVFKHNYKRGYEIQSTIIRSNALFQTSEFLLFAVEETRTMLANMWIHRTELCGFLNDIISYPNIPSDSLGSILNMLCDLFTVDIHRIQIYSNIILKLLLNPKTIVSRQVLVWIVVGRETIPNITYIANAAASNPNVNYQEFKTIYETVLMREYYERMSYYYSNLVEL